MAEMELDLNRVASEESVARVIFSPSYIFKGRVSPTAFRWDVLPSGDAEDYISVLRQVYTVNAGLFTILQCWVCHYSR